jgi:hypothetical protein
MPGPPEPPQSPSKAGAIQTVAQKITVFGHIWLLLGTESFANRYLIRIQPTAYFANSGLNFDFLSDQINEGIIGQASRHIRAINYELKVFPFQPAKPDQQVYISTTHIIIDLFSILGYSRSNYNPAETGHKPGCHRP